MHQPLPLRRRFPLLSLALAATLTVSMARAAPDEDAVIADNGPADGPRATTFVAGFDMAWGMEFLPDGQLLVTERAGRLRVVSADGHRISAPVQGLPAVDRRDHGGLLDVIIDPDFASNRHIYVSYTEAGRGTRATRNGIAVARARLSEDGTRAEDVAVLFRQKPKVESGENLGGRLAVSPAGELFITLGDRMLPSERVRAQNLAFLQGKTVRIRTDGSVPEDNPFAQQPGARPEIWSLGHRNPQGVLVHPVTGELWVAEHGPQGGDEINIARKGLNYGWPVVTFGCEYIDCAPIGEGTAKPGMEPPLTHWGRPAIAPSNLIVYTGDQMPQWKGNVFVGTLAGKALWRLEVAEEGGTTRVVRREPVFAQIDERIRDVRQGPDGALYVLTDGDRGRVVRIGL